MEGGTDPVLLVLHGLRLSGFTTVDAIAARWDLAPDAVAEELESARHAGWATYREGRLTGWMLSAEGRTEGERRLGAELADLGARETVAAGYERFVGLNVEFLAVCTDWQLREVGGEQVINDHLDAEHDARVIDRLGVLHVGISEVVTAIAAIVPRYAVYPARFEHAVDRILANDVDWFTKPVIDSYHTIWFELHEDLLATLGRSRESESAGRA